MKNCTVNVMFLAVLVLMVAATLWAQDPMVPTLSSGRSTVETNRRQLWKSNIQTPQDDGDSKGLQEAIARLRKSMYLSKPTPPPVVRRTTTRPATTQPRTPTTRPATTQPSVMTTEINDRILKLNGIADPAALADALFQAKRPDLAVVFYDRAIKGPATPETKAWLLFQAGNCSRKTNPQAALKTYDTLVSAHPGSLWSSIALVQKGIVTWRNTNDVAVLLSDIEKQSQQSPGSAERK